MAPPYRYLCFGSKFKEVAFSKLIGARQNFKKCHVKSLVFLFHYLLTIVLTYPVDLLCLQLNPDMLNNDEILQHIDKCT